MALRCLDCGYRGKKFPAGKCPACGSFKISGLSKAKDEQPPARLSFRLAMLVAVWGYFLYSLYEFFAA